MTASSAFTAERLVAARFGEAVGIGPFVVRLTGIAPAVGPDWSALEGQLEVRRGPVVRILQPQTRYFADPPTTTSETAIATVVGGQLYTVLGQPDERGRWQLRLWWKPMVTLIWLGGALIAVGGALSLVGRMQRERRDGRGRAEPRSRVLSSLGRRAACAG